MGLILPRDARLPPAATYPWRAGQRHMEWNFATVVPDGPHGRPMVFVGPLKPVGDRIDRRFRVAYVVHQRGAPPSIMQELGATMAWQHDLKGGLQGTVYTVSSNAWNTPMGLLLQKDPLDG